MFFPRADPSTRDDSDPAPDGWYAVEPIARCGKVGLDDGSVRGGTIDLDRFGTEGNTKTPLSRLRWIY